MADSGLDYTAPPSPAMPCEQLPSEEATSWFTWRDLPTSSCLPSQQQVKSADLVPFKEANNAGTYKGSVAKTLPSCWKSPLPTNTNLQDFLERAKKHTRLIKEGGLHLDPQEVEQFTKRTVSVSVVDRRTRNICRSTKENVSKALTSWGFTPQQIVHGVGAFMWDVLLRTTEEAIKMVNTDLITKDIILRT